MEYLPIIILIASIVGLFAVSWVARRVVLTPKAPGAAPSQLELWMRIAVSAAVLAAALYVILSKQYNPEDLKWAYAAVGTVVGYWLHV